MPENGFEKRMATVAALGEPLRRRLYRFVVTQDAPVSRDQAAEALGVARHLVKFHLDRLEGEGLLDVEFSRPPGRGGPGAGRPAKLYRRSATEFSVSLPERRYDLAGRIMAEAITMAEKDDVPIAEALRASAQRAGLEHSAPDAMQALAELGFEPRVDAAGDITLVNCPFHSLAADYAELVCGVNLDLITGLLRQAPGLRARLDPGENRCCVRIARNG
jgi:predicted ArsR family transcriptional regulator